MPPDGKTDWALGAYFHLEREWKRQLSDFSIPGNHIDSFPARGRRAVAAKRPNAPVDCLVSLRPFHVVKKVAGCIRTSRLQFYFIA